MRGRNVIALGSLLLWVAGTPAQGRTSVNYKDISTYNVVWNSPSDDATGSMPIGNGTLGANVWMTPDGTLHLLLSRTDTWSEICRLLKVGQVNIYLGPDFVQPNAFLQTLILKDGRIEIKSGSWVVDVVADKDSPTIMVEGHGGTALPVSAELHTWRLTPHELSGDEIGSAWTMRDAPHPLVESADHLENSADAMMTAHQNVGTIVPETMALQGMSQFANLVHDPLKDRIFGARLTGKGMAFSEGRLRTETKTKSFTIQVTTESVQDPSLHHFFQGLTTLSNKEVAFPKVANRTARWWHKKWEESYMYVYPKDSSSQTDEANCFHVTQSYNLQRYMVLCAAGGPYPLKFNGSIFTVAPTWAGMHYDPDFRRWGDGYWWQNTRLPYNALLASGDFHEIEPMFHLFEAMMPICEARAHYYYGAKGLYFPETVSLFGMYSNGDYGWNRKGLQPSDVQSPWWHTAWNQGPELVQMMLDRYNMKPDSNFLHQQLLPMAKQVLLYFETRFKKGPDGKLVLDPTQAIETYQTGVINDMPSVAGLHAVLKRLLALPAGEVPKAERANWAAFQKILPAIPMKDGKLAAAQVFPPERSNVENPEVYAIWPFRLYGVDRPELAIAQKTFNERIEKADIGWQYDGQCAALCGLADTAQQLLLNKVKNSNPKFRFPAMWGPNYDWLPDQDHGSNIMLTLQFMLLQSVDGKAIIGPAWPKNWGASFRLYAPGVGAVAKSI